MFKYILIIAAILYITYCAASVIYYFFKNKSLGNAKKSRFTRRVENTVNDISTTVWNIIVIVVFFITMLVLMAKF